VKAATELGIPRSVFLGRVVEPGEPLWLAEDTEWVLAWQAYRDGLCSGCGHPMEESFDPDNAERYATHRLRCYACAAVANAMHSDPGGQVDTAGLYVHATYQR
jgi:hypothetical protein